MGQGSGGKRPAGHGPSKADSSTGVGRRLPEAHLSTGGCSTCPGWRVRPGPQVPEAAQREVAALAACWLWFLIAQSGAGGCVHLRRPRSCVAPLCAGGGGKVGKGGERREGAAFSPVPAAWTGGPGFLSQHQTMPGHGHPSPTSRGAPEALAKPESKARATVHTPLGQSWEGCPSWARKQSQATERWALRYSTHLMASG